MTASLQWEPVQQGDPPQWTRPRSAPPSPTFSTTRWSAVTVAVDCDHRHSPEALNELCQTYWYPLYVFLRRKGEKPEDAEDLTQAFLADLLARNQLSRANRNRGRLRSFLIASLENFLHNEWRRRTAQKRGGGRVPISFDHLSDPERLTLQSRASDSPERDFNREWARALLDQTLRCLRSEWEAAGRGLLCDAFLAHLWNDTAALPYDVLCTQFDISPVNLRVTFHRFRSQYRDLLRQRIAETVGNDREVDEELRFLMRAVSQ